MKLHLAKGLSISGNNRQFFVHYFFQCPIFIRSIFVNSFFFFLVRGVAQKHSERVISPKVHLVIDAITDAITAQNPSLRYRVGRRAYLYAFLAHLPTAMQDRLFIG